MEPYSLARILIIIGTVILLSGILLLLLGGNIALPRLPGDININRGPLKISFPLGWSILISIIATIILNLIIFFSKK